jgi:YHS domain-containing protein
MKVKDPVCGRTVESTTARARGQYGRDTVYFYAESCKRTYDRSRPPNVG